MSIPRDPHREALMWLEGVCLAHEHWIPQTEEWLHHAALSEPMRCLLQTLLPRWRAQRSILEETAAAVRMNLDPPKRH